MRISLVLTASFLGITGVALGAFGAHGLREVLEERGMMGAWETAVFYHLVHGLGVLVLGLKGEGRTRLWGWAGVAMAVGVGLFSGSLYGMALGGPRWLGPVTPLGGVGFLVGWGLVGLAGWREGRRGEKS